MSVEDIKIIKKRGRRPKGGKIVENIIADHLDTDHKRNIILHLKCKLPKDDICIPLEVTNDQPYNKPDIDYNNDNDISLKLHDLQHKLKLNQISNSKPACFWCTYDFENNPIYIPKTLYRGTYEVYGCFCSPECATAHLMNESLDTSTKFERYTMINHVYAKIYNYSKNIKPSPCPYYTLEKYHGTLSIQDYRKLLNNNRLLYTVDSPMTVILPELIDEIDNNIKSSTPTTFKVRRSTPICKSTIVNKTFG
jgi:hypothetical protein